MILRIRVEKMGCIMVSCKRRAKKLIVKKLIVKKFDYEKMDLIE